MSRTYRRGGGLVYCHGMVQIRNYYMKKNYRRDKDVGTPSSDFKKMTKKLRRAKVKQAMVKRDYDNIPCFRKENQWLWY